MFAQTLAIVRNTFFESIRQPILLVMLVVATIGLIFCNLLAGFTMEDDQRMMVDLGLSTVFVSGTILAAFIATNVLNREIENLTVLTVISKPVPRPIFVLGKFLGVACALVLATTYLSFVFLLVEMHRVLETVRQPIHLPVIVFSVGAGVVGIGAALWCNYFYGKVFSSSVICLVTPLAGLAYLFSLMFDTAFAVQPISVSFNGQLWMALTSIMMAILVLTAIAIAASTRLGQVMTLCTTLGIFLMGMLSDWMFGRQLNRINEMRLERASILGQTETITQTRVIELASTGEVQTTTEQVERVLPDVALGSFADGLAERIEYAAYWLGYAILPNFQVFWLSDSVTQDHVIPLGYVGLTLIYGPLYILAALGVAVILFQRREVG